MPCSFQLIHEGIWLRGRKPLGQVIVRAAKDYANDVREGLFPKSTLGNQQTSDLAGRRVIPSPNDRAFEELKGARVPVR